MIQKLLIANRGEIAVRIIRACREMGIATVAVYSEADKDSLHTQLADEAVCIGPAPSKDSYLNMERILSAAMVTGADAVHPGFGFLSENARFAEVCEKCGLTFVGPSSNVIRALGNKQIARNTMVSAGIPVIPGTDHPILEVEEGEKEADRIGYPVIVKAALGGGGKGMRTAWTREEFSQAFLTAKKEAESAFGDGTMYIEHFVEHPRHIEFQILADSQGNVIHLGERDCSIQRNHQKMIEESLDLVKEQLRIASGLPLSVSQEEVRLEGHAIECRINAENPVKGFRPSPGKISELHFPGGNGVRVDTGIYSGYQVPPYYDSMVAKLIVHGKTREEAIAKMRSALGETILSGIDTNIDYQYEILSDPDYQAGNFDIEFLNTHRIGGISNEL